MPKVEVREVLPKVEVREVLQMARKCRKSTLAVIQELVEVESPSREKAAVDRCMKAAAGHCAELGGKVRWHRQRVFGDLLEARFAGSGAMKTGRPLLLLGHLDTVWPVGTLQKMPYRTKAGRLYGPGVLDMKAGIAMVLRAIALLEALGASRRPIILLLNSDEEVGSPVSRPVTESIAVACEAVFVLEPAQGPAGAYKTSRKGTGDYTLRVKGVAAHAGVDFAKGHSAVLELARQLEIISRMTDVDRGLTVNPGVMGGGTLANVVAQEAWTHVDFRFRTPADAKRIERGFRNLRPVNRECRLEVTGGINRPPMERTAGTVRLFKLAAKLAEEIGLGLEEAATGGGSDGNFTSALGVPTLDGMGAVGEGAHASHESIVLAHLAPRTALLAAMMMAV